MERLFGQIGTADYSGRNISEIIHEASLEYWKTENTLECSPELRAVTIYDQHFSTLQLLLQLTVSNLLKAGYVIAVNLDVHGF